MEAVANEYGVDGTYYMTSRSSQTVTFMKLETPTFGTTKFTNTQLIWNAPKNMNTLIYSPSYEVYDENDIKYNGQKTGTTMNIEYLAGGEQYNFKVMAIGDGTNYINSELSETVTIFKLATPKVTRDIENNVYKWNSVARATEYAVYVDGVLVQTNAHESGKTYEFKPTTFTAPNKVYTVEVIAKGDGGLETIDSPKVEDENLILQQTQLLTKPDFELSYSHDCVDNEGQLTVTITQESPYATGYSYSIGGAVSTSKETTFTKNLSTTGEHKVKVYALGGGFDENGIYYVDSTETGGGSDSKYKVVLLGDPNASGMNFSQDNIFSWDAVNNAAYGYKVEMSIDGGEYQVIEEKTSKTTIDVSELIVGASTVKFRVQALGNANSNVIAGKAVESKEWNLG